MVGGSKHVIARPVLIAVAVIFQSSSPYAMTEQGIRMSLAVASVPLIPACRSTRLKRIKWANAAVLSMPSLC